RCKVGDFAPIAQAFPAVERLGVRGIWSLAAPVALSCLRDLFIDSAQIDVASAAALCRSSLPLVERVRAWFCERGDQHVAQSALLALFARGDLPRLRELILGGADLEADFLSRVADSPLLPQLRVLRIEHCNVLAKQLPLGSRTARFEGVEELIL